MVNYIPPFRNSKEEIERSEKRPPQPPPNDSFRKSFDDRRPKKEETELASSTKEKNTQSVFDLSKSEKPKKKLGSEKSSAKEKPSPNAKSEPMDHPINEWVSNEEGDSEEGILSYENENAFFNEEGVEFRDTTPTETPPKNQSAQAKKSEASFNQEAPSDELPTSTPAQVSAEPQPNQAQKSTQRENPKPFAEGQTSNKFPTSTETQTPKPLMTQEPKHPKSKGMAPSLNPSNSSLAMKNPEKKETTFTESFSGFESDYLSEQTTEKLATENFDWEEAPSEPPKKMEVPVKENVSQKTESMQDAVPRKVIDPKKRNLTDIQAEVPTRQETPKKKVESKKTVPENERSRADMAAVAAPISALQSGVQAETMPREQTDAKQTINQLANQIIDRIQVLRQGDETQTSITLRQPPILEGATITLTARDQAKNEINISFANLSHEGKVFLDQQLKENSLREKLETKGIVVHGLTTTTQIEPAFNIDAGQTSKDQDQSRQQQQQQQQQQQRRPRPFEEEEEE